MMIGLKVVDEKMMTKDEISSILQEHKRHLKECMEDDESRIYWIGAIDCVENLAVKLGVEIG